MNFASVSVQAVTIQPHQNFCAQVTAGGNTIISLGLKNFGNNTNTYFSQAFVYPQGEEGGNTMAYVEVCNTGSTPVIVVVYAVIAVQDAEAAKNVKAEAKAVGDQAN